MNSLKVSEQDNKSSRDYQQLSISSSHGDVDSTYQREVHEDTRYKKQKPQMSNVMGWPHLGFLKSVIA